MVDQLNAALFILRVIFGLFLAYHGYNKVFGGGGLKGTAGWFGSIGFKYPHIQARAAAANELGAGIMMAAGLLTPFAAAGMIGIMVVAIYTSHLKQGFFVFKPGQGWEYCASIAVTAFCLAMVGPGEWSLDHALDISFDGWSGAVIAGVLGVGGAVAQLAAFYRPPADSK